MSVRVELLKEPVNTGYHFQYEDQPRDRLWGKASSAGKNNAWPGIKICGYQGRAIIQVSCVTKNEPYR